MEDLPQHLYHGTSETRLWQDLIEEQTGLEFVANLHTAVTEARRCADTQGDTPALVCITAPKRWDWTTQGDHYLLQGILSLPHPAIRMMTKGLYKELYQRGYRGLSEFAPYAAASGLETLFREFFGD